MFLGVVVPFGMWIAARLFEQQVLGILAPALGLVTGTAVGVLFVHPWGSRYLMRRQSQIETIQVELYAEFEGDHLVPVAWRQSRTIKALVDGVNEYLVHTGYGKSSSSIVVRALSGGTIKKRNVTPNGSLHSYVSFPALKRGETQKFEICVDVPFDSEDSPPFLTLSPHHPVDAADLTVKFGERRPTEVWASYWLSKDSPEECRVRMYRPDISGTVHHVARRLKPGHKYGLTWEWPAG